MVEPRFRSPRHSYLRVHDVPRGVFGTDLAWVPGRTRPSRRPWRSAGRAWGSARDRRRRWNAAGSSRCSACPPPGPPAAPAGRRCVSGVRRGTAPRNRPGPVATVCTAHKSRTSAPTFIALGISVRSMPSFAPTLQLNMQRLHCVHGGRTAWSSLVQRMRLRRRPERPPFLVGDALSTREFAFVLRPRRDLERALDSLVVGREFRLRQFRRQCVVELRRGTLQVARRSPPSCRQRPRSSPRWCRCEARLRSGRGATGEC